MLARLILALLLAAFAVPAAASACHDAPTAEAASHPAMPAHAPDKAVPVHGCIGCVPPSAWIAARLAVPTEAPASPPVWRIATLAAGIGAPPALPPPRRG